MTAKTPQILNLDPSVELEFKGPFTEVVTTTLKLGNPTNERVGFKVKTTAPKQYCVRPNSGIIDPHGEQVVSVMLQPMDETAIAERTKHKFMVQSMCVDDTFEADELDNAMRQADKKKLMDSKLKCSFIDGTDTEQGKEDPSEAIVVPSNADKEESNTSTEDISVTSGQPTAGSTPSVTRQNDIDTEVQQSEIRVLKDRTKKLTEENKALKTETDRLRQQFLAHSTTVKAPIRAPPKNESSFNLIAVLLILVALVLGYFVGTYTS